MLRRALLALALCAALAAAGEHDCSPDHVAKGWTAIAADVEAALGNSTNNVVTSCEPQPPCCAPPPCCMPPRGARRRARRNARAGRPRAELRMRRSRACRPPGSSCLQANFHWCAPP